MPPLRITRSQSSLVLSPRLSERPHPTLSDVTLQPRRRLRDGSSSRGSSTSSSSWMSRARGTASRGRGRTSATTITRRRPVSTPSLRDDDDETIDFGGDDSTLSPLSDSLSPPPPEPPERPPSLPVQQTAPTSRTDRRDLNLLALLDEVNDDPHPVRVNHHIPIHTEHISQPFPLTMERTNSASGSAATSISDPERRFTAQEKGKGRAVLPSPITVEDEDGDENIKVLGVRKRPPDKGVVVMDEVEDEERGLGTFTCPVCFEPPTRAVMTLCGHILCARCLLDSLTSAIKRNPNPLPIRAHPQAHGRGRGRNRGRGGASSQASGRGVDIPTEWTADTLKTAWFNHLNREYEISLFERGVEKDNWEAMKEADPVAPKEEHILVKAELAGLWSIDGVHYVVEGECPVCRNPIPGGFGPPKSGIGGVIPLDVKIGGLSGRKKR